MKGICQKCGQPFLPPRCRPCAVNYAREWRAQNPGKAKTYKRDPILAAEYRANNAEVISEYRANWRDKNRSHIKALNDRSVFEVSPAYAASLLKLPILLIPAPLVELKRAHLQLNRAIKERKK